MSGDPIPAKARLRGVAAKAAPPGSSARAALRMARQLALDGVGYLPRARALWRLASEPVCGRAGVRRLAGPQPRLRIAAHRPDRRLGRPPVAPSSSRSWWWLPPVTGRRACSRAPSGRSPARPGRAGGPSWSAPPAPPPAPTTASASSPPRPGPSSPSPPASWRTATSPTWWSCSRPATSPSPTSSTSSISRAWDDPRARVLHWDDDLLTAEGTLRDPRFRPSWSPDILFGANYLGRSFAVRREALRRRRWPPRRARRRRLVGPRPAPRPRRPTTSCRVPRVLTHLGRAPTTVPTARSRCSRTTSSASVARVRVEPGPAGLRVRWALDDAPHVTVVIPTRHNVEMLSRCLPSLAATDYPSFDVVIVDNGGRTPEAEAWYAATRPRASTSHVRWWDAAVQLLAGEQRGCGRRPGRGHRLPQRRHRAASTRLAAARWSGGRCSPTSASWASS